MAKLTLPYEAAAELTVRERIMFCAASGTDWQHAGLTGDCDGTVVKGLIMRCGRGAR
jgi:hypothetical protein